MRRNLMLPMLAAVLASGLDVNFERPTVKSPPPAPRDPGADAVDRESKRARRKERGQARHEAWLRSQGQ